MKPWQDAELQRVTGTILHLCGQGLLPRLAPEEGETPDTYLQRAFLARYGHLIPDEVEVLLTATTYNREWDSVGNSANGEPCLYVQFTPNFNTVWQLAGLQASLHSIHPALLGAVIGALRYQLSPYVSLFTGLDALMAANVTRFHEGWEETICEAWEEAHPNKDAETVREEEIFRWYARKGYLTPLKMQRMIPTKLYDGPRDLLKLLLKPMAQRLQGVPELVDFLTHLDGLGTSRCFDNCWQDGDFFKFPGETVVVTTREIDDDLTLEMRAEFDASFGEADPFQTVTLADFALCNADDDRTMRAYLKDLRDVIRRLDTLMPLWKT